MSKPITEFSKMDPEVKGKWLEALRSGRFQQGEGFLKDGNGCNCCLGVLAEINNVPIRVDEDSNIAFEFPRGVELCSGSYDDLEDNSLYIDVHQTPIGYCGIDKNARNALINRNDGVGHKKHDFNQIADFIEENL